ncbi:hypothetical protein JET18_00320 [Chryseobacterium sp. L7]|uniref:YD repeat-containing protein n=1 Tax=Chryseobacterium endalhagicum TaxID=2797638 RepID=A0ABS1Q9I8_9FLAO|nr:hypothetical protein [Chryseobacterium endalhagicum]MBL1219265.1 hypothetical protein [Chryseobacterium endalhagicum]
MTTISIKKSLQSVFTLLILLLLPVSVSAQELDEVILKQDLLFRNLLSKKDYGVHGDIKKLRVTHSNFGGKITKYYETIFFSKAGIITKRELYREGEKEEMETSYYHYSNSKLDSITNNTHTAKQVFTYDDQNKLVKMVSYGRYEENKDEIDEEETFYYNSENFIIKSVKSTNLVIECKYNKNNQIVQTKSFSTDNPKDIDVTEYQFRTLADMPDTVITKRNGKIQNTLLNKFDAKENTIETAIVFPDKTGRTTKNSLTYDHQNNIVSNITSNNEGKISERIQEIEYQ